jgi:cation diffusion facilitator CzcD-associated flavoprotein CzcO
MSIYKWAVVGAGPAGIAAVGSLLDEGIQAEEIAWIDPEFTAGDIGGKWRAVHSNTRVGLFMDYLYASPSFRFTESPRFELQEIDPEQTCLLGAVADPLTWISQHLSERVSTFQTLAGGLTLQGRRWVVSTEREEILSKNVILAVGSVPKKLDYGGLKEIPVEVALDPSSLAKQPLEGATVAVFGSSHSAMIALPNLLANPVKEIINFHRGPLTYAIYFEDWILFDDIGLKGQAANWARENIDGALPNRLKRCSVRCPEFQELLQMCDHVVYTVGFEPRRLPLTPQWGPLAYNATNGIIAPGLFGIGIAFPEYKTDPLGFGQHRVGLFKFMQHLKAVMPLWLNYGT